MTEMDRFSSESDQPGPPSPDAPEPSRERMKTLAALADGSLRSNDARAEIEADPQAAMLLAQQRRAVELVREASADVSAPDSLRERLAELDPELASPPEAAPRWRRPSPRWPVPRGRGLLAGMATVAAVVVVVIALTLSGGTSGSPTVAQAAALATRPATLPAPAHTHPGTELIDFSEAGVAFPYWADHFKWKAVGARTDSLGNRHAATVFYVDRGGRRLAYAIVSGPALKRPAGARKVVRSGVTLWVSTSGATTIVTWERDGHSCVIASSDVPAHTLERLASWRADGSIPY